MKAIKLLLACVFALIPVSTTFAAGDKTLDAYIPMDEGIEEHWAYEEIDDLINADIIDGFMDAENNMYVKPKENITRAQFVKIIVSSLGLQTEGLGKTFSDVKQGVWYTDYIRIASELGIIDGNPDGSFAPNANITRAEMTKVIVLSFDKTVEFPETSSIIFTDVNENNWAYEFINKASAAKVVNGFNNKFNPKNFANRAEAIAMIHRALQKEQSNLTEDEVLTSFLKDHITQENMLAETNLTEELISLYGENGTGYYRAEGTELGGMLLPLEEGDEYSITIDDENLALEVVDKSDRFATIVATGMTFTVVYKSEGVNMEVSDSMDGEYKLKKNLVSGEWKIYSYYPYFEEEL